MRHRGNCLLVTALATAALLVAGCAELPSANTAPRPTGASMDANARSLVACPGSETQRVAGVVGIAGGTLRIGGTSVVFPAGAVPGPTTFTLAIPASPYMEIQVTAGDAEHYQFLLPVTVTIDYSRCSSSALERGPISVYYIDGPLRTLLEAMGGADDRPARKITFRTDHFSGYAIAN